MEKYFHQYQHCDYDDNLVGICQSIIDWLKWLKEQGAEEVEITPPTQFTKIHPHFPAYKRRQSARKMLADAVKSENAIQNTYVGLLAILYLYHFPVETVLEALEQDDIDVKQILLDDGTPETILKEDSGKDFTALYL